MSELQKRMAALKAKKEAEIAAAANTTKASGQPSTENGGIAKSEIPGRVAPAGAVKVEAAAKVEEKPKKETKPKVECEFCGSEFSEASIKKHEKSCKDNPENKVETLTREDVTNMIAKYVSDVMSRVDDDVDKKIELATGLINGSLKTSIAELTRKVETPVSALKETESELSHLKEDVVSMSDVWSGIRTAAKKRWKQCPGYLKLIDVFDAKLQRVLGTVAK